MCDLIPLLVQSLLLCLKILRGILLAMGTTAELPNVARDLVVAEQSALLEHIVVALGPSTFDYMAATVRTLVVAQTSTAVEKTASVVAVCTAVVVEN